MVRESWYNRPPTPAMKAYVNSLAQQKGIKPPRGYAGSGAIFRAFLDKHASSKQASGGEAASPAQPPRPRVRVKAATATGPSAKRATKTKQPAARTGDNTTSRSSSESVAALAGGSAETALRIPYGNKEAALELGARYRDGGWYGPAGIDLSGFRDRGWL